MSKTVETKKYVMVTDTWRKLDPNKGKHYKVVELRETEKFLIEDKANLRFRKETTEGSESIASLTHRDTWWSTTYNVYALDSKYVKDLLEHNKRVKFLELVQEKLKALSPSTYEEALEIAKLIGVEV